jgi:hypothetical protein
MRLEDLTGVEQVVPAQDSLTRLLAGAERHIADAKVQRISLETRFFSAYAAIRMLAHACLLAQGYRPTGEGARADPSATQSLPVTLGIDEKGAARIEKLRRLRDLTEATGNIIPESALNVCVQQAESLRAKTLAWLKINHPELL